MKKSLILLISVLLIVSTSCSTLNGRVKAAVSGYPLWYYEPSVAASDNEKSFVSTGVAATERQAELLAYSNLSEALSSYLGFEISQENYRELVTLGTIKEYSFSIAEESSILKNGNYMVFLLGLVDFDNIQSFRTQEEIENENKADEIRALVQQGDEYLRNNEDIKGASCYLKSMVLSRNLRGLENQYSFESIKKEVLEILRSTSIKIDNFDTSKVSASLRVSRIESIIASEVQDCKVKASYTSVNGRGEQYSDSFTYTTDKNGRIFFRIFNNAILKKGRVRFVFDLEEEIKALYEIDNSSAALIEGLVNSKAVFFDYDRTYFLGKIGVCVLEYDIDANIRNSSEFSDKICALLSSEGIDCSRVKYNGNYSDQELIAKVFEDKRNFGCFALLKAGAVDYQISETGVVSVSMEGQLVFYDNNSKEIYKSEIIHVNGFGTDYVNAESSAFDNMCLIVYTLLKASYV